MKQNKCPKCKGQGKEEVGEVILPRSSFTVQYVMLQRWMSCTKCGWEWATIEQRNHNQSSYKNKSEYRRFDFTEHE